MASPDNDLLILALGALGLLTAFMAVMLYRRHREAEHLREIGERLAAVAATGDMTERLAPHAAGGSAGDFAQNADRLLDRLQHETSTRAAREHVYRRLTEAMHEGVAVDRDGIQLANARFAELCGAISPAQLVGRQLTELVHPDFAELLGEIVSRHRAGQPAPERFEAELRSSDGPGARLEFSFAPIEHEAHPALLVTVVEMSSRAERAAETGGGRGTAWEALDALGEGVLTTDADGRIVYANKAAELIVGKPAADALGHTLQEVINLVDEGDRKTLGDPVRQCLSTGARVHIGRRGMVVSNDGGGERSIELTVSPLRDPGGDIAGTVIALRDVSDLRGLTRQMSYQASHDALTGLVNRREFERRLQESLEAAHAGGQRAVLCYLDLDRFKAVNDECGHVAGDSMLREVAALIKDAVRDSDTVGRLGGDEFGILLVGCPLEKADRSPTTWCVRSPTTGSSGRTRSSTSVSAWAWSRSRRESGVLEDLIGAADSALLRGEEEGGHVQVYSARDEAAARQRGEIHWLQQLQSALKDGRFELHAQPIVAADGASYAGAGPRSAAAPEGRERRDRRAERVHAGRGALPPDAARRSLGRADRARRAGPRCRAPRRGTQPGINISGQTLGDAGFLEFVVDCLDRTGVAPDRVCFEVTENSVITNIEHARRFIGVLHGMGCRFALDDFGRGLSSFANLKNLSLDYPEDRRVLHPQSCL